MLAAQTMESDVGQMEGDAVEGSPDVMVLGERSAPVPQSGCSVNRNQSVRFFGSSTNSVT